MNYTDRLIILKSKVNGELYTLEKQTDEPSGRIEVKHVESGKVFKWEHMSTFNEFPLTRNTPAPVY